MRIQSRLYLRKLDNPPAAILDQLALCFPAVSKAEWRNRAAAGCVTLSDGTPVTEETPYRHGVTVFYQRDVRDEPAPAAHGEIVYRDAEILVVDKPHGIPVTPSGAYVERCLLLQMRRLTGNAELTPIHRLDRDTAGLVLFSMKPANRAAYHGLFQLRQVTRDYIALARISGTPCHMQWEVENRIVAGNPWYKQEIVPGLANAKTLIELRGFSGDIGYFRLRPETGKKHQLRLHMAHLGFPILGDTLYSGTPNDLPLQLLSCGLTFQDPLTGDLRFFQSKHRLEFHNEDDFDVKLR
jgi:tRNA pseudouridine32 synthase/23S rRNA pseudouridine746 synthase